MAKITLGWEEWVSLPQLGIPALTAKIDTGAKTSAIHAFAIEPFGSQHAPNVRFGIHPIPHRPDVEIFCSARLVDRREVTSSNGDKELRYVLMTPVKIGDVEGTVEGEFGCSRLRFGGKVGDLRQLVTIRLCCAMAS